MNLPNQKKITLYFTEEAELTDEDRADMARIPNVRHRNAAMIDPDDKLEECSYVAGPAVPSQYEHLPDAPRVAVVEDDDGDGDEEFDPHKANVATLKAKLTSMQVEFEPSAKKAALVQLYEENVEQE